MHEDAFHLDRFLAAQEITYANALDELRAGRKRTHWIWFVFPQLTGLGTSAMSQAFGLSGLTEARRYLAHPVLGARLRESLNALLTHPEADVDAILGPLDASKLRSCLTLFSRADPTAQLFTTALDRFYAGEPDSRTLALLSAAGDG